MEYNIHDYAAISSKNKKTGEVYELYENRGHLRRQRGTLRPDGHRGRLGPHHPGHEDLRLHRAERRVLLQESPGGHGGRDAGEL